MPFSPCWMGLQDSACVLLLRIALFSTSAHRPVYLAFLLADQRFPFCQSLALRGMSSDGCFFLPPCSRLGLALSVGRSPLVNQRGFCCPRSSLALNFESVESLPAFSVGAIGSQVYRFPFQWLARLTRCSSPGRPFLQTAPYQFVFSQFLI